MKGKLVTTSLFVAVAACGHSAVPHIGFDASGADVSPVGTDALGQDALQDAMGQDAGGPCPVVGAASCFDEYYLKACTTVGQAPTITSCVVGCVDSPTAHCGQVVPSSNALVAADMDNDPLLSAIAIGTAGVTINTDDGSITGIRGAGAGVISGIDFSVRNSVGVFRLHSLDVEGPITVTGSQAIAIASYGDVLLNGMITARSDCLAGHGGVGGFAGGQVAGAGAGPGAGSGGAGTSSYASGGGGGAYGADAGQGGESLNPANGRVAGGTANGDAAISMLFGGSGGGGGGGTGGFGGGGGGAVQIVSNTLIRTDPPQLSGAGGIDVKGCPGLAGSTGGGGGGGAGGSILLEAPTVDLGFQSYLFAAGAGGGGSGVPATDGGPGGSPARGGLGGTNGGDGGDGGTSNDTNGHVETGRGADDGYYYGAGGGGAAGRIRVNYFSSIHTTGGNIPSFTDPGTTATTGAITVQ